MTHRSLNAVRTVAAVLVVVYHLRTLLMEPGDGILYALTGLGPAAVLVFFVLSGYWVGGSVLRAFDKGTFSWSKYASARLVRLWIVLIPAVLLTAVLDHAGLALLGHTSVYAGDPAYHDTVPAGDLAGRLDPVTALGNLTFVQTMLVHTYGTNASLWSLAYEAVYYAILPLALTTWSSPSRKRKWISAAILTGILLLAGPKVLMYLPVWLLGVLVARFRHRLTITKKARIPALVLTAAAMYLTYRSYSAVNVLILAAVTAGCVATFVEDVKRPSRTLDALSRYADSSYSLYAVHLPIAAMIAAILTPDAAARWAPTPAHWLALAALTAGLTAVGWLFAQVTERHTDRVRTILHRPAPAPARHRERSAA